jgi:hypothetical protein
MRITDIKCEPNCRNNKCEERAKGEEHQPQEAAHRMSEDNGEEIKLLRRHVNAIEKIAKDIRDIKQFLFGMTLDDVEKTRKKYAKKNQQRNSKKSKKEDSQIIDDFLSEQKGKS